MTSSLTAAEYKQLLSRVRCQTANGQFMQWLLAMRSFALISFTTAVVNFYRNLCETERRAGESLHGVLMRLFVCCSL